MLRFSSRDDFKSQLNIFPWAVLGDSLWEGIDCLIYFFTFLFLEKKKIFVLYIFWRK